MFKVFQNDNRSSHSLRRKMCCLVSSITFLTFSNTAFSQYSSLANVIRRIAGVADDVPLKNIDEVVSRKSTRETAERILKRTSKGPVDNLADPSLLGRALRQSLKNADPTLLKQIDQLDIPAKQAAIALGRGADNVARTIPDISIRSRFIKDSGAEMLVTLGRYDDLVEDAIRFDVAAKAGVLKNGDAAVSPQLFSDFFNRNGDRAYQFWTKSVKPNWKLWTSGTVLLAVMAAPDEYLDAAGDLTEAGFEKLGKAGANILVGAIKGTGKPIAEGLEKTKEAVVETYFRSVYGLISLVITLVAIFSIVPMTRKWALRKLFQKQKPYQT